MNGLRYSLNLVLLMLAAISENATTEPTTHGLIDNVGTCVAGFYLQQFQWIFGLYLHICSSASYLVTIGGGEIT